MTLAFRPGSEPLHAMAGIVSLMISAVTLRSVLLAEESGAPGDGAQRAATRLATAAGARLVVFEVPRGGVPAVEVARAADRENVDIIVLPRQSRELVDGTVRRARVPCLIVSAGDCAFRRILAAVDSGPDSAEIIRAAATLGELFEGVVEHVHVAQGDAATTIVDRLRTQGTDLLVHGHHRGGPRNGHETGSIAARLLGRAPCAVLTVPI